MAVEIEWIDSISAAATGNKIYRDTVPSTGEVEIADIANGVQFYSDDTVAEGTDYKYEVQAHDGAGDETTQEVEGENMDYITTASGSVKPENDIYPDGNAASFYSDANSIGTWTAFLDRLSLSSVDSSDTEPDTGLYSMKATCITQTAVNRSEYQFTGIQGNTYEINIRSKKGIGAGTPIFEEWIGFAEAVNEPVTSTDWQTISVTLTCNASDSICIIRQYFDASVAPTTGDTFYFDSISILDLGVV